MLASAGIFLHAMKIYQIDFSNEDGSQADHCCEVNNRVEAREIADQVEKELRVENFDDSWSAYRIEEVEPYGFYGNNGKYVLTRRPNWERLGSYDSYELVSRHCDSLNAAYKIGQIFEQVKTL